MNFRSNNPPRNSSRSTNKSRTSGSSINPLSSTSRGSRSFIGSRTSLFSSSKKNLVSDSMRFKPLGAQILDEDGVDVTPLTLLQSDHSTLTSRKTQVNFFSKSDGITPNGSTAFQSSIYGTQPGGTVINQPFSRSIFSSSMTEGTASFSASMTDELRSAPKQEPIDMAHLAAPTKSPDGRKEITEEDLEKEIEIVLSETETIWMLDIPGTCVAMDSDEAGNVKKSNEKYEEFVKNHMGNDRYSDRVVQTINDARKFKQMQTDSILKQDAGIIVTTWDMYDTYEESRKQNADSKDEQDTFEELSSRAASRLNSSSTVQTSSRPTTVLPGPQESGGTRLPGESTFVVSMIQSTEVAPPPEAKSKNKAEGKPELDPTVPNNHPILKLDSLKDSFRTIERVVTQNIYQTKQALYRNITPMQDPYSLPTDRESYTLMTPHLDKLWSYSSPLTKKRKVTCMAWNTSNQDIVAVGYGAFIAEEDTIGLICCWSLKNPEFPERVFHAPSGITSLSFSHNHPNLLAAGLFNGTISLYNARSPSQESVLDSSDALHKHTGPVWQISWVTKEHSLGGESKSEQLISISIDGHILQWSIHKGFESSQLMNLKRMTTVKPHAQMKKKSTKPANHRAAAKQVAAKTAGTGGGGGEAYISQHAPGMGFDFWPKDPNIYLACSEEGFIHKCSCSYNEQVLETYTGHTGPVYRVSWSPFVTDYFLSCSADWTVKLWSQDKTTPLQSFSVAQKCINDVCWSPFSSTIFGCVSEGRVEIWDLELNSLDPMIVHRPLSSATQTCIRFAQNSKVVLVGDTDGEVSVYLLNNIPPSPANQEGALMAAVSSMTKGEQN